MPKSQKKALPRRVAGLKIPKILRKNRTLKAIADNPLMVKLATAAIVAAASALATKTGAGKGSANKARNFANRFVREATAIIERAGRGDGASGETASKIVAARPT